MPNRCSQTSSTSYPRDCSVDVSDLKVNKKVRSMPTKNYAKRPALSRFYNWWECSAVLQSNPWAKKNGEKCELVTVSKYSTKKKSRTESSSFSSKRWLLLRMSLVAPWEKMTRHLASLKWETERTDLLILAAKLGHRESWKKIGLRWASAIILQNQTYKYEESPNPRFKWEVSTSISKIWWAKMTKLSPE